MSYITGLCKGEAMPKQRITKKMVVDAAFDIARNSGMEQVMVKNIAEKIGCSVQPIYSYCKNMEGLRKDVSEQIRSFVQEYVAARIDSKNMFRSIGQAYVQMAKEEPYLFKMFTLQQREGIASLNDLYKMEASPHIAQHIATELNISVPQARQLHLNMLIYTIGISAIFSVTTPGISTDEIFTQQEIAYQAFLRQALDEGGNFDGK